eukprot:XP_001696251.1 mitochondrial substrate carrier protein [Chlamydomonas reinhardtii]
MAPHGDPPELHHRILAAAGASVVSAVLVNPLDVVKTRLQASSTVVERPVPSCLLSRLPGRYPVRWARPSTLADCASSKLPAGVVSGGGGGMRPSAQGPGSASGVPHRPLLAQLPMSSCACAVKVADLGPSSLGSAEGCLNAGAAYRPPTATGVLRDIMRKEGVAALWRGTDTAMLASIPMVGVYMPLYDHLLARISTAPAVAPYAPVLAGSISRTLAVLLVGPLELPLRGALLQRWQAEGQHGAAAAAAGEAVSGRAVLAANLIAGSTAGAIAAVVTTPFDVVKTRLQMGDVRQRQTGMQVLRQVVAAEGPAGLFKGWGPRAARTAPACAVVVASYEVLKLLL